MIKRLSSLIAVAVVVSLGAVGCTAPSSDQSPSLSQRAAAIEVPDSPLGEVTSWVLTILQGDATVTVADIEKRFTREVIARFGTPADHVAAFNTLQTLAPYSVLAYDETNAIARTHITPGDDTFEIAVSLNEAGLLTTFTVLRVPEIPEPAASWDELADRVDEAGASVTVSVFDVTGGEVGAPTFTAGNLKGPQPSGSMFKLIVLLAVADAVEQGTLAWDDTLTLSEATRSPPSGEARRHGGDRRGRSARHDFDQRHHSSRPAHRGRDRGRD